MIVRIDKSFQKDINKITDAKIKLAIFETVTTIRESENLSSITGLKKLTGYKDLFRIRIGDFELD